MKARRTIFSSPSIISMLFLFISSGSLAQNLPYQNDYAFGLDLSFVKQREDRGEKFFDIDGTQKPALQIFREHGYNWARIMICNEPVARLPQDLKYVIAAAKDAKKYNYHFTLDMMFSNGWANPLVQPTPSLWAGMEHKKKVEAVYEYVHNVVSSLKAEGVLPEIIQIGNEIGNGFLWPEGRINYAKPAESKWENVADYLKAGAKAIRDVEGKDKKVKIMIHVDHGGDLEFSRTFFDYMKKLKVDYDVIGFSFYPWSHGNLMDLRENLRMTALRYGKEIIVIETGYYWKANSSHENVAFPFPETPEGQKEWFQAVNDVVMNVPNGLGRGVFWWEPMQRGRGFFDDETRIAKPILKAFEKYAFPLRRSDKQTRVQ